MDVPSIEIKMLGIEKKRRQGLDDFIDIITTKFPLCTHWESNITLWHPADAPETIANRSYWKALKGGEVISTGTHEDLFIRNILGEWKCAARVIHHLWTKDKGHVGTVAEALFPVETEEDKLRDMLPPVKSASPKSRKYVD